MPDIFPNAPTRTLTALEPTVRSAGEQDYFKDEYWNFNYWHITYWGRDNDPEDTGTDISQSAAGQRALSSFNPIMVSGPDIRPGTPARTLTPLGTDTANDVDFTVTAPTLTLSPLTPQVDNAGYQLGDISFTTFASSDISWTDTVSVTAPTRTLTAPFHAVNTGTNITVNVQSTPGRTLSALPHSVANTVVLNLTTPVRQLTAFNALTGIGTLLRATAPTRTLTARQPNLLAAGGVVAITVGLPTRTLTVLQPDIEAILPTIPVPPRTYPIDFIVNDNATEYPSSYLICQRSGFRVPVSEGLLTEWNGTIVRKESFENRHPQDFVRSREDKFDGSIAPEQTDRFIGEDVPTVTAADL